MSKKASPTAKGARRKSKPKASQRGATKRARERARVLVDPKLSILTKDPLRIQIVAIATQRPISPSEFAREAEIPLNVASYQFKVLRENGFLEIVDLVAVRGSTKHMHVATKKAFISDAEWGEVSEALKPGVAGAILQDFNGRVSEAMETRTLYERDDACLYWAPRCLDMIAWLELIGVISWAIAESQRLEEDTIKRRAGGESEDAFPSTFAVAAFVSPTTEQVKQAKREARAGSKRRKGKSPRGAKKRRPANN